MAHAHNIQHADSASDAEPKKISFFCSLINITFNQ